MLLDAVTLRQVCPTSCLQAAYGLHPLGTTALIVLAAATIRVLRFPLLPQLWLHTPNPGGRAVWQGTVQPTVPGEPAAQRTLQSGGHGSHCPQCVDSGCFKVGLMLNQGCML